MNVQLVIAAAGFGERLGMDIPKALAPVCGTPLLVHTLRKFRGVEMHGDIVITTPPGFEPGFQSLIAKHHSVAGFRLIAGGETRQDSVSNALAALDAETDIVVIHDAARPFVDPVVVYRTIAMAQEHGAATVALRCTDTILEETDEQFLGDTPDRSKLWACQTPQTFRVEVIRKAYEQAQSRGRVGTDDATLVREAGGEVKLVPGSPRNMKITTRDDLAYAEYVLGHLASSR